LRATPRAGIAAGLRRLALLLLVLPLLDCAPGRAGEAVVGRPLPLAAEIEPGARVDGLVFRGALELSSGDGRFGGWSGLHVDAAGHATAVSDDGYFLDIDLAEDASGTLTGVRNARIETMRGPVGAPIPHKRDRDAEELIVLPDGTRLVVFEQQVRFGLFPPGSATATRWIPLPGLVPPTNQGIEAAVRLADDRFLLIAERLGEPTGIRRAWLGRPGAWAALAYVPPTNDDVSGATLLPNGDLVVLERDATVFTGFRSRLVRVPAAQIGPGARLAGSEILRLTSPYLSDNFEGVSARATARGVSLYLISDDNYFVLQRTLLLKFDLPDEPATAAAPRLVR
jgi:hypothetical protein